VHNLCTSYCDPSARLTFCPGPELLHMRTQILACLPHCAGGPACAFSCTTFVACYCLFCKRLPTDPIGCVCRVPGWVLWPLSVAIALGTAFGPAAAILFITSGAGAIFFLEVINYVEHYGLRRRVLPSGNYERVSTGHAWNANHMLSNAILLRLQRHTDHHMHGSRPYYTLNSVMGAPRLPASYSTMILLALCPPLFMMVMNPRVHMHQVLTDIQQPLGEAQSVDLEDYDAVVA
jgi:Fatty acid desaturase